MTDKVDVVIIGGGIAGLCTGLYLQKMGKRSIILEHGTPGGRKHGRDLAQGLLLRLR